MLKFFCSASKGSMFYTVEFGFRSKERRNDGLAFFLENLGPRLDKVRRADFIFQIKDFMPEGFNINTASV